MYMTQVARTLVSASPVQCYNNPSALFKDKGLCNEVSWCKAAILSICEQTIFYCQYSISACM